MTPLSWTQKTKIAWLAFFDRNTSFAAKAVIVLGLLYGISPLDVIPDFLPIVGQMDDIAVVIAAILAFLQFTKSIRKEMARKMTITVKP